MQWSELIRAWPGEEVVVRYDRDADAWMFIAIHSTLGKRSVGGVRDDLGRPDPERGRADALDPRAEVGEQLRHDLHVADARHVAQNAFLGCQQARREQR